MLNVLRRAHATQKLEAAGLEDAAGESQPDPDAGFTLNETKEGSAQARQGKDTPKPPKKDVVYQYDPAADPNPEQQATKPAPTTSVNPTAETREATLAAAPTAGF